MDVRGTAIASAGLTFSKTGFFQTVGEFRHGELSMRESDSIPSWCDRLSVSEEQDPAWATVTVRLLLTGHYSDKFLASAVLKKLGILDDYP